MNWWQKFKRSAAHTQANIVCTFLIMIATITYTIVSSLQLFEIRKTNSLTKRAIDQSRPWVGVEGEVTFNQDGLSWVGQENVTAEVNERRIHYPLRNSGGSPALNTQLVIQPIVFPASGSDESQIKAMIEKSCTIAENRIARNNGDLVLPGGRAMVPYQYWITDRKSFVFTPGCIVYRDIEGNLHHTRICYAAAMFVTPEPTTLETCQDQSAD